MYSRQVTWREKKLFKDHQLIKFEVFDEDDMIVFEEYHRKKYPENQNSLITKLKFEEKSVKDNISALEDAMRLKLFSC